MGIADANKILHKNYMCSIEMYFCLFILDKTLITLGFKHVFFVWCHIKYGWKLDMTSSVNFRCFTRAVFYNLSKLCSKEQDGSILQKSVLPF